MRKSKKAAEYKKSGGTSSRSCKKCKHFRSSGRSSMGMCTEVIGPVNEGAISNQYSRRG